MNQNRSGSIWYSRHQRPDRIPVARHRVVAADEDEAVVDVDVALVLLGEPDVILDLLVRRDAADEQNVDEPVLEQALERRHAARRRQPLGVDDERQHVRARESHRLELAAVVLRHAEREIDAIGERRELPAPEDAETRDAGVERREEVRRA